MTKRRVFIILSLLITTASILLAIFVFKDSYRRLWETMVDFKNSVIYYGSVLFEIEIDPETSTVINESKVLDWSGFLPKNVESFKRAAVEFFKLIVDKENFKGWLNQSSGNLVDFARWLTILLPAVILIIVLIRKLYFTRNTNHGVDTKPLRLFKRAAEVVYHPAKRFISEYIEFTKENSQLLTIWLMIWLLNLNVVSIFIAFLAYYFYFVMSFDVISLYGQACKLIIDLQVIFTKVPTFILTIASLILFDYWRKSVARNKLNHLERRNRGFINELPIVSMTVGSMGKKKTTVITDMALSQEVMFRQEALERLQKIDMKFPYFPWILFEKDIQACMEFGVIYNLATAKEWVKLKRERYEKHNNPEWQLYSYDIKKYGETYDDCLKIEHIFDALETYAQLYFIYVIETSLMVANYSIREENQKLDAGNFPRWYSDFFPETYAEEEHYAHILDFDVLRLGKKVLANNPNAGSFEFGVIGITEIGKERGNNLELREVKRKEDEANQKNDLFNSWLKMSRHSATVDYFPFIKVFCDEQRPESWGADARDLADIVRIVSSGEQRLTMPFYTIEDMLTEWAFNKFLGLYTKLRYLRGDNTLLVHILKSMTSWIFNRNIRIYNKYGFCAMGIEKERGTMDGKIEKRKYYLLNHKIYSRRFSTDCFSDYFNELAKQTNVGLNDYKAYLTEKASVDELKLQNSYFINALYNNAETNLNG